MLRIVAEGPAQAEMQVGLDDICREGARRMLAAALLAEANGFVEAFASEVDDQGHRLVVRNGYAEPRTITTGSGPIEIKAPRINDRRVDQATGQTSRFTSSIIPPWCRKSPKVAEVLPLMYLHGMSSGDFWPCPDRVLWQRRRIVGVGDHPPDPPMAAGAGSLLQAPFG